MQGPHPGAPGGVGPGSAKLPPRPTDAVRHAGPVGGYPQKPGPTSKAFVQTTVRRTDGSVVVRQSYGVRYVQRSYRYGGYAFNRRTYFSQGVRYDRFYRQYPYHGVFLNIYAPARFYPVGFYAWAYRPWISPIRYAWGWDIRPWYRHYGYYFRPYPVYASASLWLTDYLIATSLEAAYANAQAAAAVNASAVVDDGPLPVADNAPPALTPEVKQLVANEVQRDVDQENAAAHANAQGQPPDPTAGTIAQTLSDNEPHVFMAGSDLNLATTAGTQCAITQGDVLEVWTAPPPTATVATATVLASKGGAECPTSSTVSVALTDLQDMQNNVRESIDQGMSELQAKQGQGGLPAAPAAAQGQPVQTAFAAAAPPADAPPAPDANTT